MYKVFAGLKRYPAADIFLYGLTLTVAVAVKYFYSISGNPQLIFVLKPVTFIVGLFYDTSFYFTPAYGFCNTGSGIVIGKSCAGINFFIIVFCMFMFSFIRFVKNKGKKLAAFIVFLVSAYLITIIVNASRIIGAVTLIHTDMAGNGPDRELIHKVYGTVVYFFYLSVSYFLAVRIFRKRGGVNEMAA